MADQDPSCTYLIPKYVQEVQDLQDLKINLALLADLAPCKTRDRLQERAGAWRKKQAAKQAMRQEFAERRAYGLRARHQAKEERNAQIASRQDR